MDNINLKPSIKLETHNLKWLVPIFFISIFIGLIQYKNLTIFAGILAIIIFYIIFSLILKFGTYYQINEKEITINNNLFRTYKRIYKIKNISSITLKQSQVEKNLDLGTIEFEIFGENEKSKSNNTLLNLLEFKLINIENSDKNFNKILEILNIKEKKLIFHTNPAKPLIFIKTLKYFIYIIALLTIALYLKNILLIYFNKNTTIYLLSGLLTLVPIFTIILLKKIFYLFQSKFIDYNINSNHIEIYSNSAFSKEQTIIPINKIIAINTNKNLFLNKLFKIGKINISTGCNYEANLEHINNSNEFFKILSNLIEESSNNRNFRPLMKEKEYTSKSEKKEMNFINISLILIGIIILISSIYLNINFLNKNDELINIIKINIPSFLIIFSIININFNIWNKTGFTITENKITLKKGIVNEKTYEILIKNIKEIQTNEKILFSRLFNSGNISLIPNNNRIINKLKLKSVPEYEGTHKLIKTLFIKKEKEEENSN
ncbi:MAG: PH domain-containing protein [Nanoarchaeota archaeon]|nr:PH domain-containing protein [Nanoarchaeota archaeon]